MSHRLPTIAEEDRERGRAKEARHNATLLELRAENAKLRSKLKKLLQKVRNNIPTLFLKGSTVASVRALTKAWQNSTQGKEVNAIIQDRNEARARIAELERDLADTMSETDQLAIDDAIRGELLNEDETNANAIARVVAERNEARVRITALEGERDAAFDGHELQASVVGKIEADLRAARAEVERLKDELKHRATVGEWDRVRTESERMRPVVNAASTCVERMRSALPSYLIEAVDTYSANHIPAEPDDDAGAYVGPPPAVEQVQDEAEVPTNEVELDRGVRSEQPPPDGAPDVIWAWPTGQKGVFGWASGIGEWLTENHGDDAKYLSLDYHNRLLREVIERARDVDTIEEARAILRATLEHG